MNMAPLATNVLAADLLDAIELKFLLKLLDVAEHRAPMSALRPNCRTSAAKCERICQLLADKGFVTYESQIFRFTISAPGRMLLSLQTTSLPVTPDELKLLKACRGSMTADKLGGCVPEEGRSQLISALVDRKLLKVTKREILEVRLTTQGKAFLCDHLGQVTGQRNNWESA